MFSSVETCQKEVAILGESSGMLDGIGMGAEGDDDDTDGEGVLTVSP